MAMLHIEKTSSDRWYNYYSIEGLSVEEIKQITEARSNGKDDRDVLVTTIHLTARTLLKDGDGDTASITLVISVVICL